MAAGFAAGALTIGLNMPVGAFLHAVGQVSRAMVGLTAQFVRLSMTNLSETFDQTTVKAMNLETQLAILKTTTGLSGKELQGLGKQIQNLGRTMSGVDIESLFSVATFAGRIGLAGDKIVEFTKDVAMIQAVLQDIPADEVALRMQQILDVFGLGAEKALRFASALNELDKRSKATGREIMAMTAQMAGHAVILGITVQETMALAAVMRDAGIEVAIGTTAVDQVLARMATHTAEFAAVAAAADPSITFKKFSEVMKTNVLDALGLFIKGLRQFDKFSQFKVLDAMNLEGRRTAGTLLKLGSQFERLKTYIRMANGEFASGASILRDYATMAETTENKQKRFLNILAIASAEIGTKLLPIVNAFMDAMIALTEAFMRFFESIKGKFTSIADEIAKFVSIFGLIGEDFNDVVDYMLLKFQSLWGNFKILCINAIGFMIDNFEAAVMLMWKMGTKMFTAMFSPGFGKGADFDPFKALRESLDEMRKEIDPITGKTREFRFGDLFKDVGGDTLSGEDAERRDELEKKFTGKLRKRERERRRAEDPEKFDREMMLFDLEMGASPEEMLADLVKKRVDAAMFDIETGLSSPEEILAGGPGSDRASLHGKRTFDEHTGKKTPGTYALAEYYKALQSGSMESDAKKTREFIASIARGEATLSVRIAGGPAPAVPGFGFGPGMIFGGLLAGP
jgi:TP901 family phage tail tape measure protein